MLDLMLSPLAMLLTRRLTPLVPNSYGVARLDNLQERK